MNAAKLAIILRQRARAAMDELTPEGNIDQERADDGELFNVLARVLEGKPVARAFGAPGDWGYGTPIGDALAERSPPTTAAPTTGE